MMDIDTFMRRRVAVGADQSAVGTINRPLRGVRRYFIPINFTLVLLVALLTACSTPGSSTQAKPTSVSKALPVNNGTITYSTNPQDVLIRTFRGGGNFGTLEISPEVSIYGDGSYILGSGYQMRAGQLSADELQQLLHTLVGSDGLLSMNRQQFSDTPDQNATLLELSLNGKHYEYVYGTFGTLSDSETPQDLAEYHRLDAALTSITNALTEPTHPYTSENMVLLVHQDFSADPTQNFPSWTFPDFTLNQAATYECGATPADETGPNADTGCLTYTVPRNAVLLTAAQQRAISSLLKNQHGVFLEQGLYYAVDLRYLLPDEQPNKMLAMFGSQEFTYTGVPLKSGPIPQATPTP
ncbi:MAG TPA: hypothetical protein VFQ30_10460 [Ktedonobacteraceae bacterium]|nr:hypothetical protein [Ktedonobacteraceae bacterium]